VFDGSANGKAYSLQQLADLLNFIGIRLFFFKGRKKDFGKVMGVFLRIIGPLAEAI
jgi:hypothetical protein